MAGKLMQPFAMDKVVTGSMQAEDAFICIGDGSD